MEKETTRECFSIATKWIHVIDNVLLYLVKYLQGALGEVAEVSENKILYK